jgi:retinol dehydrogenase-12
MVLHNCIKKWKAGGVAPPEYLEINLTGKTVIVTGCNSGIGLETAKQFAKQGAKVIAACRNKTKSEQAMDMINDAATGPRAEFMTFDLSNLESVRQFAAEANKFEIHYLINNAGVMATDFNTTSDGFELQFGTNHLGHFLLTMLLLDNLKRNNARVVNVSSNGHELFAGNNLHLDQIRGPCNDLGKFYLYGRSKLANVVFSRELFKRHGLTAYSIHPGGVRTDLGRQMTFGDFFMKYAPFLKTPWEGTQSTLFAAFCDSTEVEPGSYIVDCVAVRSKNNLVYSDQVAEELWRVSEEAVGLN